MADLLWAEEFAGTSLDPDTWNIRRGNYLLDRQGNPVVAGWGNREEQCYGDDADVLYCRDNTLHICAQKRAVADAFGAYPYVSARIDTRDKFSFRYGRLEFTAKLPAGAGLWPAVWLMPQDDAYGPWAASGEIDILEARGRRPHEVSHALHFGGRPPENRSWVDVYTLPEGGRTDAWHTYGLIREPDAITWLVDGQVSARQTRWDSVAGPYPAPFDQPFYLIVNLAVGGAFDDTAVDENALPALMQTGPIRVYLL